MRCRYSQICSFGMPVLAQTQPKSSAMFLSHSELFNLWADPNLWPAYPPLFWGIFKSGDVLRMPTYSVFYTHVLLFLECLQITFFSLTMVKIHYILSWKCPYEIQDCLQWVNAKKIKYRFSLEQVSWWRAHWCEHEDPAGISSTHIKIQLWQYVPAVPVVGKWILGPAG